jgi:anti-sigma regulatory factor (Ser/Thr protein kinase)
MQNVHMSHQLQLVQDTALDEMVNNLAVHAETADHLQVVI